MSGGLGAKRSPIDARRRSQVCAGTISFSDLAFAEL
jgi:hypothetical protein